MTTPSTPTPQETETAQRILNEIEFSGGPFDWDVAITQIAAALRQARKEQMERDIQSVQDAGGDNEDYHIDAIRAAWESENK